MQASSIYAASKPSMLAPQWWTKYLDPRAFLVFQRLQRFYSTFTILAALVSGLAVGTLSLDEFHPSQGIARVGEGFLCCSAVTAVIAAVVATMLHFMFEGAERASRLDLAVAWSPLAILDVSIVELLIGMVCWYCEKSARWRGVLVATQTSALLAFAMGVATWMWLRMSRRGGLGAEERVAGVSNPP